VPAEPQPGPGTESESLVIGSESENFENSLTTVKVMTKTKVAPFYLGHCV